MKNRIISILLALTLLFSLVSCYHAEKIPPKNKYLTVETETVVYDNERIADICDRFADIFVQIAPLLGYPVINEERESEIAEMLVTDIIPIARAIPIYEDELSKLASISEEYVKSSVKENNDDFNLGFALGLYTKLSTVLDSERMGSFIYHVQLLKLEGKLVDAREYYEERGYGLEVVEYYDALLNNAEALGADKFSSAFSVTVFMLASSLGLGDIQGGAISLSTSDALVVMQKQGDRLDSLELSDSEWQTVAAMCEENIVSGTDSLKSKILVSLNNDDFFVMASTLMSDAVDLYATVSSNVIKESMDMLASDVTFAYERTIYTELIRNEADFGAFLDKISEELPGVGSFALSAIKAYDRAGYEEFLAAPVAEADELIAAVKAFLVDPTEDTMEALNSTRCAYIAGINPIVAYVYFYL